MTRRKEDIAKQDIEYHYKALKACPDNFPYKKVIKSSLAEEHAQRGHVLYEETDYEGAIEEYYRAREQNPEHYPALRQLGMSFYKQNKFDQARVFFHEVINRIRHSQFIYGVTYTEDFKDEFDALLRISCTHIEENAEGSLRKAGEAILSAKELAPLYRCHVSAQQKQLILDVEEKLVNSILKSIYACLSRKDWVEAGKIVNKALQFAPSHPRILAAEQQLRHAVSTTAFTAFKQTLFSKTGAMSNKHLDEETYQSAIT
ncbi:MAG: tetratricopeptide repeat protein [Legionellaceae bacterium]|nr:tetratricopeptide repeat protein [Legionellaceae bacterium]